MRQCGWGGNGRDAVPFRCLRPSGVGDWGRIPANQGRSFMQVALISATSKHVIAFHGPDWHHGLIATRPIPHGCVLMAWNSGEYGHRSQRR